MPKVRNSIKWRIRTRSLLIAKSSGVLRSSVKMLKSPSHHNYISLFTALLEQLCLACREQSDEGTNDNDELSVCARGRVQYYFRKGSKAPLREYTMSVTS